MLTHEERRDTRHHKATVDALKKIHELMQLSQPERYLTAYTILRTYVQMLTVNFAEVFSPEQLAEISIVLGQLSRLVGEDQHLDENIKAKQDQLAQALRESEDS